MPYARSTPTSSRSYSARPGLTLLLVFSSLWISALASAQGGRYEGRTEAREAFDDAERCTRDGDDLLARGEVDDAMDEYDDAEELYLEALDYDEDYEDARARLAYVYYVIGRSDDAIDLLEDGLDDNPDSLPLRRMLGINLYELGDASEAVEVLVDVDEEGGATADVLFVLALHFYEAREYSGSVDYFQRYLVENPEDAAAHGALGIAYLRTDEYDRARVEFQTVLQLDPGNLTAQINMGDVYFAANDFQSAIDVYRAVTPQDGDNYRVWFNLGKSYVELEDYENAIDALERVVDLRGDLYQGHYFLGMAHYEIRNTRDARDAFLESSQLSPEHAMSHYRLGLAETQLGNFSEAVDALERARQIDEDEPWFAWALGNVYRQQGDVDAAIDAHEAALDSDDSVPEFHSSLGLDYLAAGRTDDAIETLEGALEMQPDSDEVQRALSGVLLTRLNQRIASGDISDAERDLDRVKEIGVHPLESGLATAVLALLADDTDSAQQAIAAIPERYRNELPYRRAEAHIAVLQGRVTEVRSLLPELAENEAQDLTPGEAALAALVAAQDNEWRNALTLFERADDDGDNFNEEIAICNIRLGIRAADRDRWGEAESYFDDANDHIASLDTEDTMRVQYGLGISALHQENWRRSARYLDEVYQRRDRVDGARRLPRLSAMDLEVRLGYAYYRSGDYDQTVDMLDDVRGHSNQSDIDDLLASAHERLAREAYDSGDLRSARNHLEEAIESNPRNSIARNNLACLLYSEGDRRDAGDIFEDLADGGAPTNALYNYGVYLDEVEDDHQGAYRMYRRYIEAGGEDADEAEALCRIKEEVFGFEP